MVVNDSVVSHPDRPNALTSSLKQKKAVEPLSKNVYVSTVLSQPGALTLTGSTAKPVADR